MHSALSDIAVMNDNLLMEPNLARYMMLKIKN